MIQTRLSQGNLWWIRRLSFFGSSGSLLISLLRWYSGSFHDWCINFNPSSHLNVLENGSHQSFKCQKSNHQGNRIRVRIKVFWKKLLAMLSWELFDLFPFNKKTLENSLFTKIFTHVFFTLSFRERRKGKKVQELKMEIQN